MDILIKKIEFVEVKIYNLSKISNKNQTFQKEWYINRLNWYKNRYVFYFLYFFKIVPKKILSYICTLKKLDISLINIWKIYKFRNICSFNVYLRQNNNHINNFCRIPLFFRKFTSIFYIQKYTGCICCSTIYGMNEPIWWDEEKKIRNLSNLKIYENNLKIVLNSSLFIQNLLKIFNYYGLQFSFKTCILFYLIKKKETNFLPIYVINFMIYNNFCKKKKLYILKNIHKNFCTDLIKIDYKILF
jgi:hypothetical protein